MSWLVRMGLNLQFFHCVDLPNDYLCRFLQLLFDTRVAIWRARYSIISVQTYHPHLKGNLKRAWNVLESWQSQLPLQSRIPMAYTICLYLSLLAMSRATTASSWRGEWWMMSFMLRLAHEGMLRPAELCNICVGDIRFPQSLLELPHAVITIAGSKTRHTFSRLQFVLISSPGLLAWLAWAVEGLPAHTRLWPSNLNRMRRAFKLLLCDAGLSMSKLTLGSLRPGGATTAYRAGWPLDKVKNHGRWKTLGTLEHYIQICMAILSAGDVPRATMAHAVTLVEGCQVQLSEPPGSQWQALFSRAPQGARLPPWRSSPQLSLPQRPMLNTNA